MFTTGLFWELFSERIEAARSNYILGSKWVPRDVYGYVDALQPETAKKFIEYTHEQYRKQIDNLIREASGLSQEAIIAAMIGMKERPDSVETMKSLRVPVLFILGMKDARIPMERAGEMILIPKHSESLIMHDVAHMGFYEAPLKTRQALGGFAARCLKTG